MTTINNLVRGSLLESEEIKRGEMIASVLMLKKDRKTGFWKTEWGTKTNLGLFRVVKRLIEDGE